MSSDELKAYALAEAEKTLRRSADDATIVFTHERDSIIARGAAAIERAYYKGVVAGLERGKEIIEEDDTIDKAMKDFKTTGRKPQEE